LLVLVAAVVVVLVSFDGLVSRDELTSDVSLVSCAIVLFSLVVADVVFM
jgi:hypothetical protein